MSLRTALAGIQARVWPPNRPPYQDTNTESPHQWVASPGCVSETPSAQVATTSTGIGSSARVTRPPRTGGASSSAGRSVITRPILSSPEVAVVGAFVAGAAVVAAASSAAAWWGWRTWTR